MGSTVSHQVIGSALPSAAPPQLIRQPKEGREPPHGLTGQSDMNNQTLKRELEVYERELPTLLAEQGKFVLIVGEEVVGTFESYADALQQGYQKAGLNPFLVKRISGTENIAYFTRDIQAACQA